MFSCSVCTLVAVCLLATIGYVVGQRDGDVKFLQFDSPSDSPYEGIVQVFNSGQWGGICATVVELNEASVICRAMGYKMATRCESARYIFPDHPNNAVAIQTLHCAGTEDGVNYCTVGWTKPGIVTTCSVYDVVAVACSPIKDYAIRLMGGNSWYEGRVEVYHGSDGHDHWGTVCNDHWSKPDVKVVCRQLRYGNPEIAKEQNGDIYRAGSAGMVAFLDNVQCAGSESSLAECAASSWHFISCISTWELAAVICEPAYNTGYLSTGAIVGIVIGCLFVLFVFGVFLLVCYKKHQRKKLRGQVSGTVTGGSGTTYINQGATGGVVFINPGQQQMQYAMPPAPPAYSVPAYDPAYDAGKVTNANEANL